MTKNRAKERGEIGDANIVTDCNGLRMMLDSSAEDVDELARGWADVMGKVLDELLDDTRRADLLAAIEKISVAYSTRLALNLLDAFKQPFKRVVESVRIDHGECVRQLTFDWRLPTLSEALPRHEYVDDPRFVAKFDELAPDLAVPLLPVRKGDLMSDFVARGPDDAQLYVCGQDESIENTRFALKTLWRWIANAAIGSNHDGALLARAQDNFYALPDKTAEEGLSAIPAILRDLADSRVELIPGLKTRVSMMGLYLARHHIIWLHLALRPGQGVRLALTYRTRFAADYSPRRDGENGLGRYNPYRRLVDWTRRAAGQEPYRFVVPVAMQAFCRSYHFQMPAPPAMYFVNQRFALERNLHQSQAEQEQAFKKYYQVNGAYVGGKEEAGGPVAHLYARDLPVAGDNPLYAYARIRERPPGSTALVMGLTGLTAGFLWFYFLIWNWLVGHDTNDIDLASLSVALLGVASIWFSRAFRDDIRPRVPLVSRLGLLLVGISTLYSLLAILVLRVACAVQSGAPPGSPPICPPGVTSVFSRLGLLIVAILVTVVGIWLAVRRIQFHREYQGLQRDALNRYMS